MAKKSKPVKKPVKKPIEVPEIPEPEEIMTEPSEENILEEIPVKVEKPVDEVLKPNPQEILLTELQELRKKLDYYGVSSTGQLDVKIGEVLKDLGR